jgi:hypothetical protein
LGVNRAPTTGETTEREAEFALNVPHGSLIPQFSASPQAPSYACYVLANHCLYAFLNCSIGKDGMVKNDCQVVLKKTDDLHTTKDIALFFDSATAHFILRRARSLCKASRDSHAQKTRGIASIMRCGRVLVDLPW